MLKQFFSKLTEVGTSRKKPAAHVNQAPQITETEPPTFAQETLKERVNHQPQRAELKDSILGNQLAAKNYRSSLGSYLTSNAAKADNWNTFHDMLNPSNRITAPEFFSKTETELQAKAKPDPDSTRAVEIPALDLSTAAVMNEILDKMAEASIERNQGDDERLSCERADLYRRRWVLKIAGDANTPDCILRRLNQDGDSAVHSLLAENVNTPVDAIWKLAKDANSDIRYTLAENQSVGVEVLNSLAADQNPYVASRANKTLKRISGGTVVEGTKFNQSIRKQANV